MGGQVEGDGCAIDAMKNEAAVVQPERNRHRGIYWVPRVGITTSRPVPLSPSDDACSHRIPSPALLLHFRRTAHDSTFAGQPRQTLRKVRAE